MNRTVKLYDLGPSPHSTKARLALAYKKIPYEKIKVDPQDRKAVVAVSGQPLTPVLVHGDSVVFDSYAITRYLDANWPDAPRLYSPDRESMKRIEEWELFARTEAGPPVGMCFREFFAPVPDAGRLKKANELMNRAAARLEEALGRGPWLEGEAATAADLAVAPMLSFGYLTEAMEQGNPVAAHFRRHTRIEGCPRTRDWIGRVLALERA